MAAPHLPSTSPSPGCTLLPPLHPQILPERSYAAPNDAVNVLLDAEGHTAPGGPVMRGASRAMSSLLDDVLAGMGLHEHSGSVGTSTSAGELRLGSKECHGAGLRWKRAGAGYRQPLGWAPAGTWAWAGHLQVHAGPTGLIVC